MSFAYDDYYVCNMFLQNFMAVYLVNNTKQIEKQWNEIVKQGGQKMKWAVYDTFTNQVELFETQEDAKAYYKEIYNEIDSDALTFETVYLMEIKKKETVE